MIEYYFASSTTSIEIYALIQYLFAPSPLFMSSAHRILDASKPTTDTLSGGYVAGPYRAPTTSINIAAALIGFDSHSHL